LFKIFAYRFELNNAHWQIIIWSRQCHNNVAKIIMILLLAQLLNW